jgi:hypothetical protein
VWIDDHIICSGQLYLILYILSLGSAKARDPTGPAYTEIRSYYAWVDSGKGFGDDEMVSTSRIQKALSNSTYRFRNIPSGQPFDSGVSAISADYTLQLQMGYENYQAWKYGAPTPTETPGRKVSLGNVICEADEGGRNEKAEILK